MSCYVAREDSHCVASSVCLTRVLDTFNTCKGAGFTLVVTFDPRNLSVASFAHE
jgi:hypothetical protein